MTTRAAEIVRQGLRELANEEGAAVAEVLSYAGAEAGAELIAGGDGSDPVHCVLARDNSFSVRTVGDHPILWDALYDNYFEFNTLLAIPAGLGLTFAFDGSADEIETTEAGVWAFTYQLLMPPDNDWRGGVSTGVGSFSLIVTFGGLSCITTNVVALPSGVTLPHVVSTGIQATTDPFSVASTYALITRLG